MSVGPRLGAIAGVQHVGITVPDMTVAVHFFVELLGCEVLFSEGPYELQGRHAVANNVAPGTVLNRLTMLGCGGGACLELFEYAAPDQRRAPVANVDNGGHHVAFQVDDIDVAATRLANAGVVLCGPVNRSVSGPFEGLAWLYVLAPWGMQLELVQMPPAGIGWERSAQRRLYRPG